MIIQDIQVGSISLPLARPFKTALRTVDRVEDVVVRVVADNGAVGYGEAPPTAVITGDTIGSITCAIRDFIRPALLGRDVEDLEGNMAALSRCILKNTSAKAAVDMALYDLWAKRWNAPLYRLLGGARSTFQTDITISVNPVDEMVADSLDAVSKGFSILKIKVGINLDDDIRALTLIRQAVGKNVRLRVDANQGYTVDQALRAMQEFEKLGIDAVEQCLPWWDFDGAAQLKRENKTSVKLMLDESIHTIYDAKRAAELGCADFYNIKLMKCGGLYYGAQIADIAEQAGVGCMVGCMQENKISITAGVSLVAAKKAIVEADCDSFMFYKGDDDGIQGGFTREGGMFHLLDKPGLGIDMDI